jgi:excisionase family DNA binding protein
MRSGSSLGRREPPAGTPAPSPDAQPAQLAPVLTDIFHALDEIRTRMAGAYKPLLTVEEVARLTGRSAYTVRRWVKDGRIKATRISGTGPRGRLLVAREQLRRLVAAGLGADVPPDVTG